MAAAIAMIRAAVSETTGDESRMCLEVFVKYGLIRNEEQLFNCFWFVYLSRHLASLGLYCYRVINEFTLNEFVFQIFGFHFVRHSIGLYSQSNKIRTTVWSIETRFYSATPIFLCFVELETIIRICYGLRRPCSCSMLLLTAAYDSSKNGILCMNTSASTRIYLWIFMNPLKMNWWIRI